MKLKFIKPKTLEEVIKLLKKGTIFAYAATNSNKPYSGCIYKLTKAISVKSNGIYGDFLQSNNLGKTYSAYPYGDASSICLCNEETLTKNLGAFLILTNVIGNNHPLTKIFV